MKYRKRLCLVITIFFFLLLLPCTVNAVEISDLLTSKQKIGAGTEFKKNIILLYNSRLNDFPVEKLEELARISWHKNHWLDRCCNRWWDRTWMYLWKKIRPIQSLGGMFYLP